MKSTELQGEPRRRLAHLRRCLASFPDSVAPECYALGPAPECAPLAKALGPGGLAQDIAEPTLAKFVKRLRQARPGLSEAELLAVPVPLCAGDREAYLARLGKWRFEARELERALGAGAEA